LKLGINPGVLRGATYCHREEPVIIASVQTLEARLRHGTSIKDILGDRCLIFEDECHELAFRDSRKYLESAYKEAKFIGLTATPYRLGKSYLGQKYETVVAPFQPPDLVDTGKVVGCTPYSIPLFDESKLDIGDDGDFTPESIARQARHPDFLAHVVNEYIRVAKNKAAIMVGSTIDQARDQCKAFNEAGIPAEVITGSTPSKDRIEIFKRSASGVTRIICSVGTLKAGVSLNWVSAILFCRATKSKALFQQVSGRACRSWSGDEHHPKKNYYLLLDFGSNVDRFGNPMDYQDYYIGPKKVKDCMRPSTKKEQKDEDAERVDKNVLRIPQLDVLITMSEASKRRLEIRSARQAAFLDFKATGGKTNKSSPDVPINAIYDTYGHIPLESWTVGSLEDIADSDDEIIAYLEAHAPDNRYRDKWLKYHKKFEFGG
jgi:superfamily II DNA or RNA helicase